MWRPLALFSNSKLWLQRRLQQWRQRHPRLFCLVLVSVTGAGALALTWLLLSLHTFKRTVNYEACQISYGETVAAWEGQTDSTWDQNGYHYETKRFKVNALAPKQLFPRVAEAPANTITTGGLDGSAGCAATVSDLVDTNAEAYKWYGARAQAARLGQPVAKASGGRADDEQTRTKPSDSLVPPVAGTSLQRAAAWVDDAAQAVLQTHDRSKTQLLWCQGLNAPLDAGDCGNLGDPVKGQLPLRGAGYLFTADNCPLEKCATVDSWYNRSGAQADADYSNLIGKNERGELLPFYLHLAALSTYANTMGSWMNITFKYPLQPEITTVVTASPKTVPAGGSFEVALRVSKIGPNLKLATAAGDLTNQPLKETSGFSFAEDTITTLNNGAEAVVTAKYQLTGGEAGKCYDLPVKVAAEVAAPNPASKQPDEANKVEVSQPASARYCIQQPTSQTVYTYEVNSRGGIQSDLNDFAAQVAETYADARGWTQAGITLKRVASGGNFTVVLSSPDQMTTFSSGCDAIYSCNAGRYVIINDERWRMATSAWNSGGGSLRDYRHMVVNHETGHWLGFGHLQCPAAGAPAPVMQQQSISLQGCAFNPWPTPAEVNILKARLN